MGFGGFVRRAVNTATGGLTSRYIGGSSSYGENLRDFYTGNWGDSDRGPRPFITDETAAYARQLEQERNDRIAKGKAFIDEKFAGYNDDFYQKYNDDYTNYYNPQLEDQYSKARKKLILNLAKNSSLNSSAGINKLSEAKDVYDRQQLSINNQALNAVNTLRGNVDARKTQLYQDNTNAADPGSALNAATNALSNLQPTLPNSPLANAFADFFNNVGNASAIYGSRGGFSGGGGYRDYNSGNGSSGRVIG
jgi:hypothetical protein